MSAEDARLVAEVVELLGHVFPPFVVVQRLDFPIQLVLSKCFELLECRERIAFPPEQHHNLVVCMVINKHTQIKVSFWCRH